MGDWAGLPQGSHAGSGAGDVPIVNRGRHIVNAEVFRGF